MNNLTTYKKEQSLEIFISKIDSELSIRKKELIKLKNIIDSIETKTEKFSLLRYTYPSVYAHYEGFLKSTFFNFIDFLREINVNFYDLNPNLILLCMVPSLENHLVKQSSKIDAMKKVLKPVFEDNKNIFETMIRDKYIINQDTLESTLSLFDIDPNNINIGELKNKSFPLDALGYAYKRRNGIAHGELNPSNFDIFDISNSNTDISDNRIKIATDFWLENYNNTLEALDLIKDIFYNYIEIENYLHKNVENMILETVTSNNI
ncbi:TPA: MAE_28990/MAE_18760 family HEPN-like nuclease [Clostridioides difficile]